MSGFTNIGDYKSWHYSGDWHSTDTIGEYKNSYYNSGDYQLPAQQSQQAVWPAIIAAVGTIASSVLGATSQNSTNKANKAINQAQIEASEQRLKEEQEYNNFLLSNQKQMQMSDAKAAGVNPAFAAQSSIGGMSQSPSVPVPQAIPMQSFDWSQLGAVGSMISNALLNQSQTAKNYSETTGQNIENKFKSQLLQGQVSLINGEVELNNSMKIKNEREADRIVADTNFINAKISQTNEATRLIQEQIRDTEQDVKYKMFQNLYADQTFRANLDLITEKYHLTKAEADNYAKYIGAQIFELKTRAGLNQAQAETESHKQAALDMQAYDSETHGNYNIANTGYTQELKRGAYWSAETGKFHFTLDKKFGSMDRQLAQGKAKAEIGELVASKALKWVYTADAGYDLATKAGTDAYTRFGSAIIRNSGSKAPNKIGFSINP